MSTAQWIATASVAVVFVSAAAIVFALKGVRDQLRVSVFLAYTDRYARAMTALPFEARQPGSNYRLSEHSHAEQLRVLAGFRDYLNLCSEEVWLHSQRRIDRATWEVWQKGIQQIAELDAFRDAWEILAPEYAYYPEFKDFISSKVSVTRRSGSSPAVTEDVEHEAEPRRSAPTAEAGGGARPG